ncbi:MAG: hypothetical protein GF418_13500 [Chitinivibrionales bacterium]|nr:hypothetical protein [Chitinivibrionales bacterium]MBD3396635.1 hypothetical protein [Chitinivibrionales bacterium]
MRAEKMLKVIASALLVSLAVSAAESDADRKVDFGGWGWLTFGRVTESYYEPVRHARYDHTAKWLTDVETGLWVKAMPRDWADIYLHWEFLYVRPIINETRKSAASLAKTFNLRVLEAYARARAIETDRIKLNARLGYFNVKYNPEVRNLGEYLLRSFTYPQYLVSGFEIADKVKNRGLQIRLQVLDGMWTNDVLVNSEIETYPINDLSFSYITSVKPVGAFLDIGAGISFSHLVSFDPELTTPGLDTAAFSTRLDRVYNTYYDPETGDSTLFTFRGEKVMGRLTIDPKEFIPLRILGENDLKLYTEAAIIGLKDYPEWYENIRERVPIMVGFNVPAFKLLDVLAVEVERFQSPYTNSTKDVWGFRSPIPYTGQSVPYRKEEDLYANGDIDDWRWSVYASRRIADFIRVSGQVARDHASRAWYTGGAGGYEDITQVPGDWYWMARVMFYF